MTRKAQNLKIVEGAYYKRADGSIAGPAILDRSDSVYPWNVPNKGCGQHWYRNNGESCIGFDCARLVSRVTTKKQPKPINYQRIALLMYKAKTIREARGIYERGRK